MPLTPEDDALLSTPIYVPPPGTPTCPRCDCYVYPRGAISLGDEGYVPCPACSPVTVQEVSDLLVELSQLLDALPFADVDGHVVMHGSTTEETMIAWTRRVREVQAKLREIVR